MASILAGRILKRLKPISNRQLRTPVLHRVYSTPSSSTPPATGGVKQDRLTLEDELDEDDYLDILEDGFDDDDTTTLGHMMLQDQRDMLHYMRLIEHEMPKLVAFRKPFIPPGADTPIVVRSMEYIGEDHPASTKRVVVAPVDHLPLRDEASIHRIKLLAGSRWSLRPPADSGISALADWGNGFVKIACEDFPKPAMNLKWASDALDRLIEEANNKTGDQFLDVPVDTSHLYTRARKHRRGEHVRGRLYGRPTVHDFPVEWLPINLESEAR